MSLRWDVLAAILGMALATYALRAGGYAILRASKPSRFAQAMLNHLPGCIFVAFALPALAAWGWRGGVAALAVLAVMARTRSYVAAIGAGVAVVWGLATLEVG
jgi:uncharacterized membrane protein